MLPPGSFRRGGHRAGLPLLSSQRWQSNCWSAQSCAMRLRSRSHRTWQEIAGRARHRDMAGGARRDAANAERQVGFPMPTDIARYSIELFRQGGEGIEQILVDTPTSKSLGHSTEPVWTSIRVGYCHALRRCSGAHPQRPAGHDAVTRSHLRVPSAGWLSKIACR
jgi:hypothetical protein